MVTSYMDNSRSTGKPEGAQHCPKCPADSVKAATLTARFVYLRCGACGEVWSIPERRRTPRSQVAGGVAETVDQPPSDDDRRARDVTRPKD